MRRSWLVVVGAAAIVALTVLRRELPAMRRYVKIARM